MVAKIVLSYTISFYDFTFPPGQDASSFLSDCKNHFILKPGKLECVFTKLCPSCKKNEKCLDLLFQTLSPRLVNLETWVHLPIVLVGTKKIREIAPSRMDY